MKTNAKRSVTIWPYLAILACLFLLSVTAPRAWDRMERKESLNYLLATRKAPSTGTRTARSVEPEQLAYQRVEFAPESSPPVASQPAEPQAPKSPVVDLMTSRYTREPAVATPEEAPQETAAAPAADLPIERLPPVETPQLASDEIPQLTGDAAPQPASDDRAEPGGDAEIAPLLAPDTASSDSPALGTPSNEREADAVLVAPVKDTAGEASSDDRASERLPATDKSKDTQQLTGDTDDDDDSDGGAPGSAGWPLPRLLVDQLTRAAEADATAGWVQEALSSAHELCQSDVDTSAARAPILKRLRELSERKSHSRYGDPRLESQMARARHTLTRWVDIWEAADDLERVSQASDPTAMQHAAVGIRAALDDVDRLARKTKGKATAGWREYLKLDELRKLTAEGQDDQQRREVARKVLDRLASTRMSKAQLKFAGAGPVAVLQTQLHAWAAEPVAPAELLKHIAQYEHTGMASDARLVANDFRALSWSAPLEAEKLSQRLDVHYRNANVRIAMTSAMINRLMPQPDASTAPVNDRVMNVPIYGNSTTSTKLSVLLVPDPNRIRMAIQANGLVTSDTVANAGPAQFRSQGQANFRVRKLVVIGPHGMSVWPAVAEADNSYNYLQSVETNFDGVPLVGSLVRNMAVSRHEESQGRARAEVEQKVAYRARTEFDAQVRPLLMKAADNIEKREMATLDRLGLEMAPIEFSTTSERIVARVRLATPEQLGGYSPRPRAPSDCWYSLQMHESALNNVLEQLKLNGRTFELPELFDWVAKKLDRPQMAKLDDLPENVKLTFAKQDAIRVRCETNRIEVLLSFAELTQGSKHWRNFTVRAYYKPSTGTTDPKFVRDDTIYLEGRSLKGKPQVLLRAIFSKVLSVNRPIAVLNDKITTDPRLKDLRITQFVVEDGWVALAYSPPRKPANVVRRPKK